MSVLQMGDDHLCTIDLVLFLSSTNLSMNNTPFHTVPSSPAAMTRAQTPVSSIRPSAQMESMNYTIACVSGNARCQEFVLSIHFSFVFHATRLGLIRALWQANGVVSLWD